MKESIIEGSLQWVVLPRTTTRPRDTRRFVEQQVDRVFDNVDDAVIGMRRCDESGIKRTAFLGDPSAEQKRLIESHLDSPKIQIVSTA